jgi:hypothetical protein
MLRRLKSLSLTTVRRNGAAEFADVTENVLKIAKPVLEALKDPKIQPYFRSLSVRLLLFAFLYPDTFHRYTRRSPTNPVSVPVSFPQTEKSASFSLWLSHHCQTPPSRRSLYPPCSVSLMLSRRSTFVRRPKPR